MFMLRFVCDYCENIKQPGETWISGMAAENVGTQAARREVIIDPVWRYERAVMALAVHFCCVECKDNYLAELFDQPASRAEICPSVEPAAGRRTVGVRKATANEVVQKRTISRRVRKP